MAVPKCIKTKNGLNKQASNSGHNITKIFIKATNLRQNIIYKTKINADPRPIQRRYLPKVSIGKSSLIN